MIKLSEIEVNLDYVQEGLKLWIDSRRKGTLFDAKESAKDNNEARYQLVEGCYYDYKISDPNYQLGDVGENIVQQHKRDKNIGTISPNIFVGTLETPIFKIRDSETPKTIALEVQSVKADYREDYRDMLEFITEKCTDLLLQVNSPVSHYFDIDYTKDSQTLYQKFAFIKSIIGSDEFKDAVNRVVTSPVTVWTESSEQKDVRSVRRFTNRSIKELLNGANRSMLPNNHSLRNYGLETVPERIASVRKIDSVDTPENRFVKHALETFLKFCSDINQVSKDKSKLKNESTLLIRELESQLHHSIFREISKPNTLKLNSPVLQRKEGYREILRVWLMFDLAAKLIWTGGEDVYGAGKKDVANLYEYWLFFKLLDLFQSIFDIDPKDISELLEKSDSELNLRIKQGRFTALDGVYDSGTRKLNIRFNYNRSFSAGNTYPASESWTTALRPDYTLSFWPLGISETDAEREELIVHIHFDAKYKVANLNNFLDQKSNKLIEEELDEEKIENRKGIYKNADLLKMHAYKDAIRRTGGAYVLYPGDKPTIKKGFHEIIPGLGAFPVRPSKTDDGIGDLRDFILEVINHFENRASQREKLAYRTFDIHETPPDPENDLREFLPETYGLNRNLIPDDTFVLVGYYHERNLQWIEKSDLYNARAEDNRGSLKLGPREAGAKYLLLHTAGEMQTGRLFKIVETGPRVFSKQTLIKKGYKNPSQNYYLVYKIKPITDAELMNHTWDIRKLERHRKGRASALPFSVTMSELMRAKVK